MRDDRLINGRMGSSLTPPNHPSQNYEVEFDLRRKKENRGGCNIETALELEFVSDYTKNRIKQLLAKWEKEKPAIDNEEVQKWIQECQSHMGASRAETYIRKYYPEYKI